MKNVYIAIVGFVVGILAWFSFKKKGTQSLDTSRAIISDESAGIYADQLLGAMDVAGTDEKLIASIFAKINSEDYKLVSEKFGIHKYFINSSLPFFGYPYNLTDWIKAELNLSNFPQIVSIIRGAGFVI